MTPNAAARRSAALDVTTTFSFANRLAQPTNGAALSACVCLRTFILVARRGFLVSLATLSVCGQRLLIRSMVSDAIPAP
jgi:hypothetical protein